MNNLPRYLVRLPDCEIFSLNSDGLTYSIDSLKEEFPNALHGEFQYCTLSKITISISEDQIPKYRAQQNKYWESYKRTHSDCGE